jgi:plastocyanin
MKKSYLAVLALVAIVGALALFSDTAPRSSTVEPQQKTFDLVVKNRKLVSGPSVLSVNQGDMVSIQITVDENEELHLHGYNLHIDLEKGIPGSLSFLASASGRFPYELEHSSTEIGALEVQPK